MAQNGPKWPKMAKNGHFDHFWRGPTGEVTQNGGILGGPKYGPKPGFGRKRAILAIFEGHFSVVGGSEAIFGQNPGSWPRTPDLAILTPFLRVLDVVFGPIWPIWPKWPKMAQNGPKWAKKGHFGPIIPMFLLAAARVLGPWGPGAQKGSFWAILALLASLGQYLQRK